MNCNALPLTASQLHLWKSQAITPDSPLLNQVITAALKPAPLINAAQQGQRAWERVCKAYPVLSFVINTDSNGNPVQHMGTTQTQLNIIDLRNDATGFERWLQQRKAKRFELDKSLVDAAIVLCSDEECVFYLCMHHLIADAWSTVQILLAFEQAYSNKDVLPSPEYTFGDYVQQTQAAPQAEDAQTPSSSSTDFARAPAQARRPEFYGLKNYGCDH